MTDFMLLLAIVALVLVIGGGLMLSPVIIVVGITVFFVPFLWWVARELTDAK